MRSLSFKTITLGVAFALAGCLVSEEPVLDERTGKARPLEEGLYVSCAPTDFNPPEYCTIVEVARSEDFEFRFYNRDDDETNFIRFRRVRRDEYAAQIRGDGVDGYIYYFARRSGDEFNMTNMVCEQLDESLRSKLAKSGDLVPDGGDENTCIVRSLRGLTAAAKAYAKREPAEEHSEYYVRLTPSKNSPPTP